MIGVLVHIIKKAVEFSVSGNNHVNMGHASLGTLFLWIHAREIWFWGRALLAILGFGFLVTLGNMTPSAAFGLGYFLDSLADLIQGRLTTKVSPHAEELKQALINQLKPPS